MAQTSLSDADDALKTTERDGQAESISLTGEQRLQPQKLIMDEDSAVTRAEKLERQSPEAELIEAPSKRLKLDPELNPNTEMDVTFKNARHKGVTPIKPEFLLYPTSTDVNGRPASTGTGVANIDGSKRKEKSRGQNSHRNFGSSKDEVSLCSSRALASEFSPSECRFGDRCKFEHDLRKYLNNWKREDLATFEGICPVWKTRGRCAVGWKCRFVGSHMQEREVGDGRKELVLVGNDVSTLPSDEFSGEEGVLNAVSNQTKIDLTKRKITTPKADAYTEWLNKTGKGSDENTGGSDIQEMTTCADNESSSAKDNRANYFEAPLLPSEKRRIYFGAETPVLAPLTTQGNLPFRRLCVDLGAQITYSEMAMSMPLIQGQKSEWALIKAHESEAVSPKYEPKGQGLAGYDNSKDFRFGVQIAANKPWQAFKATEILAKFCPRLRVLDLNCGCPIDLVYRTGAGSALLDSPSKLEKIIRGMNVVSGEIPITTKIRMGTKDGKPTAYRLAERLICGGQEAIVNGGGSSGIAAITLHGRSRQQRYTKSADWEYIADCAALIRRLNERDGDVSDTIREADGRYRPPNGKVYFIGNGDCYSHTDYNTHLKDAKVDAVMIARGALIKPWIFEEIQQGQYLDKSANERLSMVEQFVRYGLETWGSDEVGIGTTRRFLLEWLNFASRYVPVGVLEHLPPNLQDRAPAWRGRNELEMLLGSDNYKDWIKISEMFLGPAHKDFKFEPKHKSNSYEIDAEG